MSLYDYYTQQAYMPLVFTPSISDEYANLYNYYLSKPANPLGIDTYPYMHKADLDELKRSFTQTRNLSPEEFAWRHHYKYHGSPVNKDPFPGDPEGYDFIYTYGNDYTRDDIYNSYKQIRQGKRPNLNSVVKGTRR